MPHHKYFYSDLFQLMNVSISGPYVMKLSLIRDGHKAYFFICQHFMCDNLINREKIQCLFGVGSIKYCGKSQRFTYETNVLILEKYNA